MGPSCDCGEDEHREHVQRDIDTVTAGGGSPLPAGTCEQVEQAFSHDFSTVRIHSTPAADEVAAGLAARALTFGPDILFRAGGYQPGTETGDRLLAHELAHVVQQAQGKPGSWIVGVT